MDESEGNISTEDGSNVDSTKRAKKLKKRSLVERELETSLTSLITSPVKIGETLNTSRYGRARRMKNEFELNGSKTINLDHTKSPRKEFTPVKVQSPVYRMHASNSPHKAETPKNVETYLGNQIDNIYQENISLSRFSSDNSNSPLKAAKKFNKVYVRKDLIQNREEDEEILMIKNLFSPKNSTTKTPSRSKELSSVKYSPKLSGHNIEIASVVKALDFDNAKKKGKKSQDTNTTSDNDKFEFEAKCSYQVGDMAWARMGTFPFWPCIITRDPNTDLFVKKKMFGRVEHDILHVTFCADNGRRSWIVDNMLRPFLGRFEFESTREKFTAEDKKKDPRLYSAYFISEKKQALWNTSVEEAEKLFKEPIRFRIDIFNDILIKYRASKKNQRSGKISRTDSDVSLSESLYDSLFSVDSETTDDAERTKKTRNKSFDVSEVVTACLDNMAAKTGIIKIQKQSHMDRWLQKAKSKTPEKTQAKNYVSIKVEKRVKTKSKRTTSPTNAALQKSCKLRKSNESHIDLSVDDNNSQHILKNSNLNTNKSSESETDIADVENSLGLLVKVESLDSNDNNMCGNDSVLTIIDDEKSFNDQDKPKIIRKWKPTNQIRNRRCKTRRVNEMKRDKTSSSQKIVDTETVSNEKSTECINLVNDYCNLRQDTNVTETTQTTSNESVTEKKKDVTLGITGTEIMNTKSHLKKRNVQANKINIVDVSFGESMQNIENCELDLDLTIDNDYADKTEVDDIIPKKTQLELKNDNITTDSFEEEHNSDLNLDNAGGSVETATDCNLEKVQNKTSVSEVINTQPSLESHLETSSTGAVYSDICCRNISQFENTTNEEIVLNNTDDSAMTTDKKTNYPLVDQCSDGTVGSDVACSISEALNKIKNNIIQTNAEDSVALKDKPSDNDMSSLCSNIFTETEKKLNACKTNISLNDTIICDTEKSNDRDMNRNDKYNSESISESIMLCNTGKIDSIDNLNSNDHRNYIMELDENLVTNDDITFEKHMPDDHAMNNSSLISNNNAVSEAILIKDECLKLNKDNSILKTKPDSINMSQKQESVLDNTKTINITNIESDKNEYDLKECFTLKSQTITPIINEKQNSSSHTYMKSLTPTQLLDSGEFSCDVYEMQDNQHSKNKSSENCCKVKLQEEDVKSNQNEFFNKHSMSESFLLLGNENFKVSNDNSTHKSKLESVNASKISETVLDKNKKVIPASFEMDKNKCDSVIDNSFDANTVNCTILNEEANSSNRTYVESPTFTQLLDSEEFLCDANNPQDCKNKNLENCCKLNSTEELSSIICSLEQSVNGTEVNREVIDDNMDSEQTTSEEEPSPEYESFDEDFTEDFRKHLKSIENNIKDKKNEEQIVKICDEILKNSDKLHHSPTINIDSKIMETEIDKNFVKCNDELILINKYPEKAKADNIAECSQRDNFKAIKAITENCKTLDEQVITFKTVPISNDESIMTHIEHINDVSGKETFIPKKEAPNIILNGDVESLHEHNKHKRFLRSRLSTASSTKSQCSPELKKDLEVEQLNFDPKVVIIPLEKLTPEREMFKIFRKNSKNAPLDKNDKKSRLSLKKNSHLQKQNETKSVDIEIKEKVETHSIQKQSYIINSKKPKKVGIGDKVEAIIPELVKVNGYHKENNVNANSLDLQGKDLNIDILDNNDFSLTNVASERVSRRNLCPKTEFTLKNSLRSSEFLKYLELRQDYLLDEQPDLNPDEIESYLFKTWQYEENLKSDIKKTDVHESNLVKGLNEQETTSRKSTKKPLPKDTIEKFFDDNNYGKDKSTFDAHSELGHSKSNDTDVKFEENKCEEPSVAFCTTNIKKATESNLPGKGSLLPSLSADMNIDNKKSVFLIENTFKKCDTASVTHDEVVTPKRTLRTKTFKPKRFIDIKKPHSPVSSKSNESKVSSAEEKQIPHYFKTLELRASGSGSDKTSLSHISIERQVLDAEKSQSPVSSVSIEKTVDIIKITQSPVMVSKVEFDTESISSTDSEIPLRQLRSKLKEKKLKGNEEIKAEEQIKEVELEIITTATETDPTNKNNTKTVDKITSKGNEAKVKQNIKIKTPEVITSTIETEPSNNQKKKYNDNTDKGNEETKEEEKVKEEILDITTTITETEMSNKHKRKKVDKNTERSLQNPDFVKYLELRQDTLMDENPQLSNNDVINYLYKTWLYEESSKSDEKKNDDLVQANLVKGLDSQSTQEAAPPKRVQKKNKIEKIPDPVTIPNKKPKRRTVQPFYYDDFSDIEDELEMFEIFESKKVPITVLSKVESEKDKNKSPKGMTKTVTNTSIENVNTEEQKNVAIQTESIEDNSKGIDGTEQYFLQLTTPKPNVFKGLLRERVCEICERAGNLVKCKNCNGTFHLDCFKEEADVTETNLNKSRKKKKRLGRKPKNFEDSESQSDDKSQDVSADMSLEEILPPEIYTFDAETFEASLAAKMKEILEDTSPTYDSYSSADGTSWADSVAGKCEIVDVKLKSRSVPKDYSNFKCKHCQIDDTPVCFVCKLAVSKSGVKVRQKCSIAHCCKYYHVQCLDHWPQTHFNAGELSRGNKKIDQYFEALTCPRHVCHTCVSDDPRGCKTRFCGDKLTRCVRCPATYHSFTKCLPAGSSILTASHIICPRHYDVTHKQGKVPIHVNTGWCFICAQGGSLICCEYCPTSFHAECLNIKPPEGRYMCEDCETGRLPLYGEMVWVKLGHYRWWPGLILHPSEIPENIMMAKHGLGEFVVRFFGQYDHYWVNRGRVFPYQEGDSGRISSQRSKLDAAFTMAMEHAQRAFAILKDVDTNEEESLDIASSLLPPHYVKLKSNKPCGSLCGRKLEDLELSLTQCECNPDEPDPCGLYSQCLNRMLLTECGPTCRAGDRCHNRAFEKRRYPKLIPYRTPHRGWGLKTLEPIKAGQFVIEYVGELIDEDEFQRRMRRKHEIRDENFYFLRLDKEKMIDAGPKGNLARFMNHCCEPNCETQKWRVLGDDRVGLFAINDIPANSEVTFNYNLESTGIEKKQCMCGAKRCSGYIGAKPKQDESQQKKRKDSTLAAKRTYKKRKNHEESPTTSKNKTKRLGRPPKPKELTEIEKDLLIIKNATTTSSDESRRQSLEDKNPKTLKRKRAVSTDEAPISSDTEPSVKKQKIED